MNANNQLYTISVYTENFTGMLQRVTTIFTRRKLNIDSITCSESEIKGIHRYTIVVKTNSAMAENLVKQLEKQVDVLRACSHNEDEVVFQEIALYKVSNRGLNANQIETIVHEHNARILTFCKDFIVVEKTGNKEETQKLYEEFQIFGLLEFVRSGRVAITKPLTKLTNELKQLERNYRSFKRHVA